MLHSPKLLGIVVVVHWLFKKVLLVLFLFRPTAMASLDQRIIVLYFSTAINHSYTQSPSCFQHFERTEAALL
jgi:hypothetical protein